MSEPRIWASLLYAIGLASLVTILSRAAALSDAAKIHEREVRATDPRSPLRRALAWLLFVNRRNSLITAVFMFLWTLNALYSGPPPVIRPAAWRSIGLFCAMAFLQVFAAIRDERVRRRVTKEADELNLYEEMIRNRAQRDQEW